MVLIDMWIRDIFQRKRRPLLNTPVELTLQVDNPQMNGKKVSQIVDYLGNRCSVISILRRENMCMCSAASDIPLREGDQLLVSANRDDVEAVKALIGKEI